MKWYPIINRRIQDVGPALQSLPVHSALGAQIREAFKPTAPFKIDCDYAYLEWETLKQCHNPSTK